MTDITVPRELLRQVLDALREIAWSNDSKWQSDRAQGMTEHLRNALEQPVQEPLFWVRLRSDGMYEGPIHNAQIEKVRKESGGWTPLYTAQQPRKAVKLTDSKIDAMWREAASEEGFTTAQFVRNFARAIEAAVWEKLGVEP